MSTVAEVKLWGRTIGAVVLGDGATVTTFQYDPAFVRSGIEVAPLTMPLSDRPYSFPTLALDSFHGLPMSAVEELFRRMVFNIVARNQDDHVKNIAFLMNRAGEWSLSPAFDLTYSYQPTGAWTSSHQMTLNGKRDQFLLEDFEACANGASMKRGRHIAIIEEVRNVVARWRNYAEEAGVLPGHRDRIEATLRLQSF